jgi:GNAT superfamily N-acetyltransferase
MKTKKIRIETLAENNLKDLPDLDGPPESCRFCLYWEFPKEWNRLQSSTDECLKRKTAWVKNLAEGFGPVGKVLYYEDRGVGYCQYAPVEYLPAGNEHPTGTVSQDAVLLSCLFIGDSRLRKKGLGTRLLKAACDELRKKGVKALETFGRKGNPENPSGPVEFYLKAGFKILKDDPEYPLLRLDL